MASPPTPNRSTTATTTAAGLTPCEEGWSGAEATGRPEAGGRPTVAGGAAGSEADGPGWAPAEEGDVVVLVGTAAGDV